MCLTKICLERAFRVEYSKLLAERSNKIGQVGLSADFSFDPGQDLARTIHVFSEHQHGLHRYDRRWGPSRPTAHLQLTRQRRIFGLVQYRTGSGRALVQEVGNREQG